MEDAEGSVIVYAIHVLQSAQRRYCVTRSEFLAVWLSVTDILGISRDVWFALIRAF